MLQNIFLFIGLCSIRVESLPEASTIINRSIAFHQNGKGKYIILNDYELVYGMVIPKIRSWYTAQDSTFLGTDTLNSFDIISHNHQ